RSSMGRTGSSFGNRPGTTGTYPGSMPGTMGAPAATTPAPAAGSSFTDRLAGVIKKINSQGEFQILGQTKMIADERTNSLLIFASREDMKMITNIVAKLDIVLAQVLIEAVVCSVTLQNGRDLGV